MTAVKIAPPKLAAALGIGLFELAGAQREWACDRLEWLQDKLKQEFVDHDRLAVFDEAVAMARVHLERAIAAEKAYHKTLECEPS